MKWLTRATIDAMQRDAGKFRRLVEEPREDQGPVDEADSVEQPAE